MAAEFRPHEVAWTREKSNRIWEHLSSNRAYEETYFSRQVGDDLIDRVRRQVPLRGTVLDFGCGQGFLLEKMLARNISCQGLDFSAGSVDIANARLGKNPLFRGAVRVDAIPAPLAGASFDAVFFVETLEHVLPDELDAVIGELRRLLKPGGHLVVTTRNEENLDASKILCPECGCVFHHMQHVSSWSAESLATRMARDRFRTVFCDGLVFAPAVPFGALGKWLYRRAWRMLRRRVPNLLYVGSRTE